MKKKEVVETSSPSINGNPKRTSHGGRLSAQTDQRSCLIEDRMGSLTKDYMHSVKENSST
jgi:hypothetical protein